MTNNSSERYIKLLEEKIQLLESQISLYEEIQRLQKLKESVPYYIPCPIPSYPAVPYGGPWVTYFNNSCANV